MASKGIIKGTSIDNFEPEAKITRADFVSLLIRTFDLRGPIITEFSDVKPTDYYYEAVGIAKSLGLVIGDGKGNFNPHDRIKRQDMITIMGKLMNSKGMLPLDVDVNVLNSYKDKEQISEYARENMAAMVYKSFILGDNSYLKPLDDLTRAEAAVVIYRLYNDFYDFK